MILDGKVAVVTGGGSGIGAAAAELLAREGACVVLAGRRLASLEHVANVIRRAGGTAIVRAADFTSAAEVEATMQLALDSFGQLNLAVNAAGAAAVRSLVDTEEALFDQVLATNVKTAVDRD